MADRFHRIGRYSGHHYEKAGLWTDSRYFLQAAEQLEGTDITLFKERMPETPSIAEWLFKRT